MTVSIRKFRIFVLVLNRIVYWSNYSIRFEISNIRTSLVVIDVSVMIVDVSSRKPRSRTQQLPELVPWVNPVHLLTCLCLLRRSWSLTLTYRCTLQHSSTIRISRFFSKLKNASFYFFEVAFQKSVKNVIQKFQVSEYIKHYTKVFDSCIYVCNTMALVDFA